MQTSIDELYRSLKKQEHVLQSSSSVDIADLQDVQRVFVKYLIIATSSFFEEQIKIYIKDFVAEVSNNNKFIEKIIDVKLLDRGYYSIINWDEKTKLKTFCKFFDADFQKYKAMHDSEIELYFIEYLNIVIERNCLVHKNLVSYNVNNTLDDVFDRYKRAKNFVDTIPAMLKIT